MLRSIIKIIGFSNGYGIGTASQKICKEKVVVIREDIQKNLNRINQAALPFMRKLSAQAKKSKSNEIVLIAIIKEVE